MTHEGFSNGAGEEASKPLSEAEKGELSAIRRRQFKGDDYTEEDRQRLLTLQGRERAGEKETPLTLEEVDMMKRLEREQTESIDWTGEKGDVLIGLRKRHQANK